jgi:hypothetical protein
MKHIKNDRGYALLVVLLLIVLVMSISATFMAGSLNHAEQEQTVDVSNQSVAAAEMGVLYYSADFERSLDQIKQEVLDQTGIELNAILNCLKSSNRSACDTLAERTLWESNIDNNMKEQYVKKILIKINELIKINGVATESFTATTSSYAPEAWTLVDVAYTNNELRNLDANLIQRIIDMGKLHVKADIEGTSVDSTKNLNSLFSITIPATFLNPNEIFNVDQEIIAEKEDASYEDVFQSLEPDKSCGALLIEVQAGTAKAPFECKMSGDEKLSAFIGRVKTANLSPEDFWVHVSDFQKNVCSNNCNNLDFLGTNVVVNASDTGATNNMNNMVNGNLIIKGTLSAKNNMNNLGENGSKQTILVKELNIGGHIKNLNYTNLVILGNKDQTNARLNVSGHFQIDNYSNLCFDIDKISEADLNVLSEKLVVTNSGRVVYYASSGSTRTFKLDGVAPALNDVLVKRSENYSTFLKNCGITIKSTQTVPISSPIVMDTEFEYEVEY